jgi:hypothetical protein
MLKISLTLTAAAALLLGIAGCGKTTIDQSSEVDLVNKALDSQNAKAKSVDCPDDVEAKDGETFECEAVLTNGKSVTFDIKVGDVSDDNASLQITGVQSTGK